MNWFVRKRAPDDLPPLPGPVTDMMGEFAAAAKDMWLRQDTFMRSDTVRTGLIEEMEGALGVVSRTVPAGRGGKQIVADGQGRFPQAHIEYLTTLMADARAKGAPFASALPASPDEFETVFQRRREREYSDNASLLERGSHPITQFAGQMGGAIADPINILSMALGGAPKAGQLAKFILSEAAISGGAAIPGTVRESQVAEELGLPKPTFSQSVENVLLEAGVGGAFASLIAGGVKGLTYMRDRAMAEAAATPPGANPARHQADTNAAESALRAGKEPPAPRALPSVAADAPPGWSEIRGGIFAGESGGDYDALFGYQNRPGGVFENVRLTEMSVDEAIAFSNPDGRYAQFVKGQVGRVATPMGAYQIVGTTLRDAKIALGLKGDELMTPDLQERLGQWVYRQQGTGAWVGYKGPRKGFVPVVTDEAPRFSTSRGYTRDGQVSTGAGTRIDVEYQVVDASILKRATGDLQPRDRSRAASDEQVAEIAARLDPARLMPSPEADRGAPIVGPDDVIESGNGRVMAIVRAYDLGLDRSAAYRAAIEELTGEAIPEGVTQPVLIARRTSEFASEADRQKFIRESNQSTTARMSATELARSDARDLDQRAFAAYRPGQRLGGPENAGFVRRFMATLPQSERAGLITDNGALNIEGLRRMRQALFARAFDATDLLKMIAETENPAVEGLLRMLESVAPDWAAFRAMVEAGYIRPEFDITDQLLDTVRLIASARIADREGQSVIAAIRDKLVQGDLLAERDPLVEAIIDAFYKGDRARRPEASAEILSRYMAEATAAGRADTDALTEAVTPADVLGRAVEGYEKRTDFAQANAVAEEEPDPVFDVAGVDGSPYADGTAAREVQAADAAIEGGIRAELDVLRAERADDSLAALNLEATEPHQYVATVAMRQPFDTLDELYARAATAQAHLTEAGQRIADQSGARFVDPGLKARAQAEEKMTGRKRYGSPRRLTDISRAGFVVGAAADSDAVVGQLAATFRIIDEGWVRYPTGYVDRKILVIHDDGMMSEIQIWTPEMKSAKDRGTSVYEARRAMPSDDPRVGAMVAEEEAIYAAAAGEFSDIAFSTDGTSMLPKVLAKRDFSSTSVKGPRAVDQTSSPSTTSQSDPGSTIANAKGAPEGSANSAAGRASQSLKPTNFMGGNPSVEDTLRMGVDRKDVNSLRGDFEDPTAALASARADLAAVLDEAIPTGDGSFTVRQLLDDIEADRDLADVMEVCRMKGQPQ